MRLKTIKLAGFKSFVDPTTISLDTNLTGVVGPNGSGKSNVSDAIVWALGEQSANAVRGQQMQDLLFGGAEGVPSASAAEVELVFDNSDGGLDSEFSELSVTRRLSRDGDGEYRINGARCRLVDVIEVLSDSGLGKEMHSVLSQGKVDEIVASKPKERRLLLEEAAGLGKHRKRRRRAQLKLAKTRDNLDRVLDVEREARSRIKPLKRQAEAAETHARLELQANELRAEQASDQLLLAARELEEATELAAAARADRETIDGQLADVAKEREVAEQKIAAESARREQATESLFSVRAVYERIVAARERAGERIGRMASETDRCLGELGQLELDVQPQIDTSRVAQLEAELAEIERQGRAELEAELVDMRQKHELAKEHLASREDELIAAKTLADQAEQTATSARRAMSEGQQTLADARRERARLEAELGAVEQYLCDSAGDAGDAALAEQLGVEPGYELAVTAVVGRRLRAAVVDDIPSGQHFLDGLGEDGGSAMLAQAGAETAISAASSAGSAPPTPGAVRLSTKLNAAPRVQRIVEALFADAWVVESLQSLPGGFNGVAVTTTGRVFFGATGELRQVAGGGEQRVLAERNRRDALAEKLTITRTAEATAQATLEQADAALKRAEQQRDESHAAARKARVARDELSGAVDGQARAIERRIEAGLADGPTAVRRAAIEAELKSERSHADQMRRAAELQQRRREDLEAKVTALNAATPIAERLSDALAEAAVVANEKIAVLSAALDGDREAGELLAKDLRAHATREAQLQTQLREHGERVTTAEVRAQRARDMHAEAASVTAELAEALGRPVVAAEILLDDPRREEIATALARIARRRELLGPINPLAKDEYAEALAHVEELEAQRDDLERALKELGDLIKEIDKTIRTSFEETFASTSAHFEELIGRLFPGGSGRLNLVQDERPRTAPLTTAAGEDVDSAEAQAAADAEEDAMPEDPDAERDQNEIEYGVEVEVTLPGAKSGRRLSLLSGGERSLVALAFLFAVFLTKPCPFYIFDEAEAALDDVNIDRLVALLREHSDHSQFIVITHQKRTMDAADCLYGVSMGSDGISKVITRRMTGNPTDHEQLVVA
ncbi:MAG: chromosome segregation SMC family protein, partial [Solirubrobacterales bacterium]